MLIRIILTISELKETLGCLVMSLILDDRWQTTFLAVLSLLAMARKTGTFYWDKKNPLVVYGSMSNDLSRNGLGISDNVIC